MEDQTAAETVRTIERYRRWLIPPEKRKRFWELSHCTLRDVNISNPFWTYCHNFTYGKRSEERNLKDEPAGWIYSSGLYEGYVRIPWDDTIEPQVSVPAKCVICKRETKEGIVVEHAGTKLGFCTNRHYVQWWKTIHEDASIETEHYESPEERYEDS